MRKLLILIFLFIISCGTNDITNNRLQPTYTTINGTQIELPYKYDTHLGIYCRLISINWQPRCIPTTRIDLAFINLDMMSCIETSKSILIVYRLNDPEFKDLLAQKYAFQPIGKGDGIFYKINNSKKLMQNIRYYDPIHATCNDAFNIEIADDFEIVSGDIFATQ